MVAALLWNQCTSVAAGSRDFTATGLPEELNLSEFANEVASQLQCTECGSLELHMECEKPTLH